MTAPTTEEPPDLCGRYRLLAEVGRGGMGVVYRAVDRQLDRVVAVKFPQFDGPPDHRERAARRFEREAKAAARVLHPNVCPIFDAGEDRGRAFVVMAFVEGPSLARLLADQGRFVDVSAAVRLVRGVLDGLAAVHAVGLVHRDVKPGNVLLTADGRPLLTDFGLARDGGGDGLTSEGVVLGTPAYMAPEQALGDASRLGPWTDLYAAGVLLYELLTGRTPFTGPPAVVLAAVARDDPPPPRQFRPELPDGLEAVVLRALGRSPGGRFADARAFAAELSPWAQPAAPQTVADETGALPVPQRRRLEAGRLALWLAGALLAALSGVVLAFVAFHAAAVENASFGERWLLPLVWVVIPGSVFLLAGLGLWTLAEFTRTAAGVRSAARSGLAGWLRRAAAQGAPLDEPDDLGETPLLLAAGAGHLEAVKVLLQQGADPRARNQFGQSALEVAQARGDSALADLLRRTPAPLAPPARRAAPPPAARRWLVGAVLAGALALVGYHWVYRPYPTRISRADYDRLLKARQIKQAFRAAKTQEVEGEVTSPADHPAFYNGRFFLDWPDEAPWRPPGNVTATIHIGFHPPGRVPPAWVIVPMLLFPAGVALLVALPLGSPSWFPWLCPAPRRPT
jgi:hypothetical protein